MASEITVTFSDGGVFNGYASSYTKDGQITYYFDIDKKYRVQVADSAITLQQYLNTNGSWYNIDIITAVQVTEIQTSVDLSNYYTKAQSDQRYLQPSALDDYYTKQQSDARYLQSVSFDNYYTKAESDDRFVNKTGDTMSGKLTISYDDYSTIIGNNIIEISQNGERMLQLYKNNINIYQGYIYLRYGGAGTTGTTVLNSSGIYLYNLSGQSIGYLAQENNRANAAIHLFNDGRLVLHNGAPATTEAYIQYQGSGTTGYNGAIVFFNSDVTLKGNTICTRVLRTNNGIESHGTINVISSNINLTNGSYSYYISANYLYFSVSNSRKYEQTPDGIDIYNGATITYHSGAAGTTEQFTRMNNSGIIMYNTSNSNTFTINPNTARFEIANAYTILMSAYNLISATAGTQLQLRDSNGVLLVGNATQALNNAFYGENFLNALNSFLQQLQDQLYQISPGYRIISEIAFAAQNYGGGFQAGGGSSRGGGVGRRS